MENLFFEGAWAAIFVKEVAFGMVVRILMLAAAVWFLVYIDGFDLRIHLEVYYALRLTS